MFYLTTHSTQNRERERNVLFNDALNTEQREREMFYLTTHSTQNRERERNVLFNDALNNFFYGYMA